MKPLREIGSIFFKAFQAWNNDQGPRQAAAMAYFAIFTIAPLLIVITAFVGAFLGEERVRAEIASELSTTFGHEAALLVDSLIQNVNHPSQWILSTLLSIGLLVLGAIALFNHLQAVLNFIWKVPQPSTRSEGILRFLRDKAIAFAMMMIAGALLLLSLIFSTLVAVAGRAILDPLPGTEALVQTTNFLLSYVVTTALFALMFKLMPNARTFWLDSIIGGAVTTLLFSFGRGALAWYFANATPSSAYGAAGSLIAILLWVNFSAQIILYGAEFTHVFSQERSKQEAKKNPPKNPYMP